MPKAGRCALDFWSQDSGGWTGFASATLVGAMRGARLQIAEILTGASQLVSPGHRRRPAVAEKSGRFAPPCWGDPSRAHALFFACR